MRTMLAISPSLFISPNGGSTLDVSSAIPEVVRMGTERISNDKSAWLRSTSELPVTHSELVNSHRQRCAGCPKGRREWRVVPG
jgi:hypothetical protein